MEYLALAVLIVLNGLFAMSEIALVAARKSALQRRAADGDAAASTALKLKKDPNQYLSSVQVGITSIGILNGIVAEMVIAEPVTVWLQSLGVPRTAAGIIATVGVVASITYLSIVIGELVPKRIAQLNPERVACRMARPMAAVAFLTRPFVVLLSASTNTVLTLLGIRPLAGSNITEEEIHALLQEGSEAGVIEPQEHDMVRNVFRLDDRQLASLMIPRAEMVFLDIRNAPETNLQVMLDSDYARFPVCDGGLDHLLGVVQARQVLADVARGERADFSARLHPCIFVPETLTGMDMIEQFRCNEMQMAFVIDEFGELEGMVTLEDVLATITGECRADDPDNAWAFRRADGSWLLSGAISIPELKDRLGLASVPEEGKNLYHTASGMLMLLLGRVPATGDRQEWGGWSFEVVDMDGKRIDKILATPGPPPLQQSAGKTPRDA